MRKRDQRDIDAVRLERPVYGKQPRAQLQTRTDGAVVCNAGFGAVASTRRKKPPLPEALQRQSERCSTHCHHAPECGH